MLSMCMPVLVLTLAVDGGEWLDSAPPPRVCIWRLCVPHSESACITMRWGKSGAHEQ